MSYQPAHLNLIDSFRRLFELDSGAAIEVTDGWLFAAATPDHPAISNTAFRIDDDLDPDEFLARAKSFFGKRGRGFSVWARGEQPEDRDLIDAAESSGLMRIHELPEMVLRDRAKTRPLADGAELKQVTDSDQAEDYWRIAASAYADNGFPPEVFGFNDDHAGLWADDIAAFIAYLDGKPVSIAMTVVNHGVAGIYWVGSLGEARGKGLGTAVTAAATNAGFDRGAEVASLQASPKGKPIYEAMGYETIFSYRLLMSAKP